MQSPPAWTAAPGLAAAAMTNGTAHPDPSVATVHDDRFVRALRETIGELGRARATHAPMHSAHEGYAVLLEEVDELWHAIKHESPDRQREEAIQVAAMALRMLIDVLYDA